MVLITMFKYPYLEVHKYQHFYGNIAIVLTKYHFCPCTYFRSNIRILQTSLFYCKNIRAISYNYCTTVIHTSSLHCRHNGHDSVSNDQPHDCLLNRLFSHRSEKISKLRVTGLCAGNSSENGEFPAQMASNAENVFIWWRHHVTANCGRCIEIQM